MEDYIKLQTLDSDKSTETQSLRLVCPVRPGTSRSFDVKQLPPSDLLPKLGVFIHSKNKTKNCNN